ncbi:MULTISPECIES: SDR family oxidoreductase [unclassified Streptomyces]|uniref:SDR family oxidoreductase n=1 Tax=unclassified Streptomyces TaxID=2593676 RepID=UPI001CC182E5|nr:SDR family oxidoreductase [Streptomyces sp. 135]
MTADRVLVTGAGGAVGSAFLARLAERAPAAGLVGVFSGEASRDAYLERAPRAVTDVLRPVVCDLTDEDATLALTGTLGRGRRTVLVHAAANVSWSASPEAARLGNVAVTRNTARLARALGDTRFLLLSSAYTAVDDWEYRNTYEESKAEAERLLKRDFADLDPSVFSCSLVVGHSATGAISRFHGIYPLLGLVERYEPPFLPGDRDGLIDIVPVDWVASELCAMTEALLAGGPARDVVASAGEAAPRLSDLVSAVVTVLNRARREEGRPELADVPLVPYRRWDFLRRSVDAWKVTEIRLPNRQFLDRLIGIYRPYFENARVRLPENTTCPAPHWSGYVDGVVEYWRTANVRRPPRVASAS